MTLAGVVQGIHLLVKLSYHAAAQHASALAAFSEGHWSTSDCLPYSSMFFLVPGTANLAGMRMFRA